MLCSTSLRQPFRSWVILDSEASGLKRRPRITELCLLAVVTDDLKSTGRPMPRVVNKLQLCFNPETAIAAEASLITGLYNDVLEQMSTFTDQATLITRFLCTLPQPVCIIAHNGHRFDFPLLQSELRKANHTLPAQAAIYCVDSLQAFRVLDGLPLIPEWLKQKDYEENSEKQRRALISEASSSAQSSNGNEGDSAAIVATTSAHENKRSESGTVSPKKCHQSHMNNSFTDSASVSRVSNQETGLTFDCQGSINDSDLVAAYDAAMVQAKAEDVCVGVSPIPEPTVSISLQSELEATPVRHRRWTNPLSSPGPAVKKRPPTSVSVEQRQKVARQLFREDLNCSSAEPFQDAPESKSVHLNRSQFPDVKRTEAGYFSSQGSLLDGEQVGLTQRSVASFPSRSSGAEKPLYAEGSSAVAVTNHHLRAVCNSLPSSSVEQGSLALHGKSQTANGLPHLASTQNQLPEALVTSPFCNNAASQTTGRVSVRAPLSASGTSREASYKLSQIYRRQFGQYPELTHVAEGDCIALLRIIMSRRSEFMAFVEEHAVRFDTVEPMY